MMSSIRDKYKQNKYLRFLFNFCVVLIVYFSVRYWKSMDHIEGEAPVIHASQLNGEFFDLREMRDKPVLVHFWATWCPVCQMENSNIASLAQDYQVVTVASWSEGEKEVANYLKQENLEMPVIVDEDGELAKLYAVKAVPASFVLDAKGVIQFIETGYTTEPGLRLRLWWLSQ